MKPIKVLVISDTHFEFDARVTNCIALIEELPHADIAILAGDICVGEDLNFFIDVFSKKYPYVLYVLGNHEYYGNSPDAIHEQLYNIPDNVHIMRNDIVTISGHRFIGTTLWFPDPMYHIAINDHYQIKDFIPWVYEENKKAVRFLKDNLRENDVLITHHLPSPLCTPDRFKGSDINCFFVTDISELLWERKPKLAIHGHSHDSMDETVNNVRFVRNSRGYAGREDVSNFKGKIIELKGDSE